MTTRFLDRPEGRIAYDVQGNGPLVVCVPGMGDLRSGFRFLVPPLVAAGYRVATMDLRGHGESGTGFTSYDDVAAGTDALALVSELGGGPAVLLGSSMGAGAVTWAAAERPEAVAGLVLLGPFVRHVPVNPLKLLAFRAMLLRPWGRAAWLSWYTRLFPGRRPADHDEQVARLRASLAEPTRWRAFVATTRTSHAPVGERLAEVRAPALVVMGSKDPDFSDPVAEARAVASLLRADTEPLVVDGAGHYPHAERPEAVTPAVLAHLARVTASA